MCPDPQLLSIYIDGEVPSPWKEKMEAHLAECSECAKKFAELEKLRLLFKNDMEEKSACVGASMEKVWNDLEIAYHRHGQIFRSAKIARSNVWRRRISLPLPVAAAAAIFLVFMAGMWLRLSPAGGGANANFSGANYSGANYSNGASNAEHTNFMLAAEEEIPVMQVTDMESLLKYLGSSGSENIIFVLPESRNFSRSGDPAMIRAADYYGRQP